MEHDIRPWGEYFVLDDQTTHKAKRIVVKPGGRLSLQSHKHRSEVWTCVTGFGKVTIDSVVHDFQPGDVVEIALGAVHRIENPGSVPLIFIEVQLGEYFGEDDIIRYEDDYQRI